MPAFKVAGTQKRPFHKRQTVDSRLPVRSPMKMDNGITFLPNDRYLLENEKFRLYYTAAGDEAHNFIVVVEDNFGNSFELEFDLNNRNAEGKSQTVMYAANFKPMPR